MTIKKIKVSIDLDNILPQELYLSVFSKKVIVKAVKKSAAKKALQRVFDKLLIFGDRRSNELIFSHLKTLKFLTFLQHNGAPIFESIRYI